jgi:hypothetical protein
VTSRPARRLFVVTVLVLAGLATHGTYAGTGDEPHYLAIAHSIAFDHDLDVSNNYGAAEPLVAGGGLLPEHHVAQGTGGVVRPVHDVGMPMLFAPYVRVMAPTVSWLAARMPDRLMQRLRLTPSVLYRHAISAVMILLAGVLALAMFDVFQRAGVSERVAFWTALLIAVSPPLLVFSILFFTELLSALLTLIVFRKIAFGRADDSVWTWGLAGVATGLLVLVHVRNGALAVSLAALALFSLARRHTRAQAAAYASAVALMLALRTALNHHMWGTWLTTPHARVGEWTGWLRMISTASGRLAGLLIDQEYGLLPYAPIFIVAAFGFSRLARTHSRLTLQIAAVTGCYLLSILLPITNYAGWTGGWSPPARFLVPILPLLAVGVAAGMRAIPRVLLVTLVAIQIGIDAYAWQHPKILWNAGDGVAAVCQRAQLRVCEYLPSFVGTR